jgi:hypothetical protein
VAHDDDFFAALDCPNSVTWTNDIQGQGYFTATDIACMSDRFDLSSYDDVKQNAKAIYDQVSTKQMPKPDSGEPPWTDEMVNTFACWIKQQCPQ